jgi:hypothetical protein
VQKILNARSNGTIFYKQQNPPDQVSITDVNFCYYRQECKKRITERANLVTRMCEIKHYYQKNIKERRGIEA